MLKSSPVLLNAVLGLLKDNCLSIPILPCLYHQTIATMSFTEQEYLDSLTSKSGKQSILSSSWQIVKGV